MAEEAQLRITKDIISEPDFVSKLSVQERLNIVRQCREDLDYVRRKFEIKSKTESWSSPKRRAKLTRMRNKFIQRRVEILKVLGEEI